MGEAHLSGIQQMWATSEWQSICAEAGASESSSEDSTSTACSGPKCYTDPLRVSQLSPEKAVGVRQALLESTMRLKTVASEKLQPKKQAITLSRGRVCT